MKIVRVLLRVGVPVILRVILRDESRVQATEESLIQAQRNAEELFKLVSEEGAGSCESQRSRRMREYDLYLNPRKPKVGFYVRNGAGLPDLADPQEWVFDGAALEGELPADIVKRIETNGHAFRDLD